MVEVISHDTFSFLNLDIPVIEGEIMKDLIYKWNEYAADNDYEGYIYDDLIDAIESFELNPVEAALAVFYGNVEINEHIYFDVYGNLYSLGGSNGLGPIDESLIEAREEEEEEE